MDDKGERMPRKSSATVSTSRAVKEFRTAAKGYSAKATKSKKAAQAVLVELGIHTPKGKLTKKYKS